MTLSRHYGFRSLRFKLALSCVAIEVIMLTVLVWNSIRITDNALHETFQNHVTAVVPLLNSSLASPLAQRDYAVLNEQLERIINKNSLVYLEVRDELHQVVAAQGEAPEHMQHDTSFQVLDDIYDQTFEITIAGHTIGYAHYGLNVSLLRVTLAHLRNQGMALALAEILLTFLLMSLLAYLLTRHLRTLAQAARAMEGGDYSIRVPASGRDEVAVAAHAFNAMAQTVEHDITEREHATEALRASEAHFRAIFESAADGIFIIGTNGYYINVNAQGCRMLGYTHAELMTFTYDHVVVEEQKALAAPALANASLDNVAQSQWLLRRKDGALLPVEVNLTVLADGGHLAVVRDITERKQAAAEVERLAYSDELTGLPNRTALYKNLTQAINHARSHGHALAILLLDLNDFREINDTLGHQNGDRVLRLVSERLRSSLWKSDMVARLGGDEFAVLLPHLADKEHINFVVGKIVSALRPSFLIEGVPLDIQAAIGIALYPEHGQSADALLQHADVALYAAKEAHAEYLLYSSESDHYNPQQLALMAELRTALKNDELVLYYQPVIDIGSGKVAGVEALVRWQHPSRGLLFPDTFIPAAEKTGLITPLTSWVLAQALQQQRRWYLAGTILHISVNISVRNLQQTNIVNEVSTMLRDSHVPPEYLTLEITESVIMDDPERARQVLAELHHMGIHFAIDDFGIGHSSLAYLQELPVDRLKVDKSFVMDFKNPANAAIVRATIDLAHNMGLSVTAEGVENEATLDALILLGCDYAQGHYLSQPQAVEQINIWLRDSPWALQEKQDE